MNTDFLTCITLVFNFSVLITLYLYQKYQNKIQKIDKNDQKQNNQNDIISLSAATSVARSSNELDFIRRITNPTSYAVSISDKKYTKIHDYVVSDSKILDILEPDRVEYAINDYLNNNISRYNVYVENIIKRSIIKYFMIKDIYRDINQNNQNQNQNQNQDHNQGGNNWNPMAAIMQIPVIGGGNVLQNNEIQSIIEELRSDYLKTLYKVFKDIRTNVDKDLLRKVISFVV